MRVDKMVGFHIKAVLISRAALLNAAVIELQGQETDSSPVDEKIPVSEHGSTSFLFFYSDGILSWETAKFERMEAEWVLG